MNRKKTLQNFYSILLVGLLVNLTLYSNPVIDNESDNYDDQQQVVDLDSIPFASNMSALNNCKALLKEEEDSKRYRMTKIAFKVVTAASTIAWFTVSGMALGGLLEPRLPGYVAWFLANSLAIKINHREDKNDPEKSTFALKKISKYFPIVRSSSMKEKARELQVLQHVVHVRYRNSKHFHHKDLGEEVEKYLAEQEQGDRQFVFELINKYATDYYQISRVSLIKCQQKQ